MIWIWIALGISLPYVLLLLYYYYYWNRIEEKIIPHGFTSFEGVSVIVVARNEEDQIGQCIRGILLQNYPHHLFEIIIIDDHSSDRTVEEIIKNSDPRIQLFHLKDFPEYIHHPAFKKSGITLAVDKARFETIIVTDADCIHGPDWIRSIMYNLQTSNSVFQTAPVILLDSNTLLEKMQEVEQLILMLITGAGIFTGWHDMANGANMAFTKTAFHSVKGYDGNYNYASGDDMFLVEKMRKQFPSIVSFAKSLPATVHTTAKKDWPSLLRQRLRWAGKNAGLQNKMIQRIWLFIGAYHVSLILFFILGFFPGISWWPLIILITFKWSTDLLLISAATAFFNGRSLLRYFIPMQLLYTFYVLRLGWAMATGKSGDWEREE